MYKMHLENGLYGLYLQRTFFSATLEWLLEYNANPFGWDWQPNILITVSSQPQMETRGAA